jgi:hypothetical protein
LKLTDFLHISRHYFFFLVWRVRMMLFPVFYMLDGSRSPSWLKWIF